MSSPPSVPLLLFLLHLLPLLLLLLQSALLPLCARSSCTRREVVRGRGRSLPEMLKWNHKINASCSQKRKKKKKMEMSFDGWPQGAIGNKTRSWRPGWNPPTPPHLLDIPYICSSESNKGEIIPANCSRKVTTEDLCPDIIASVCAQHRQSEAPTVTLGLWFKVMLSMKDFPILYMCQLALGNLKFSC